jgi:hypothetical protein
MDKLLAATKGHDKSNPIPFDHAVAALEVEIEANAFALMLTDYDRHFAHYIAFLDAGDFPLGFILHEAESNPAAYDVLKLYAAQTLDEGGELSGALSSWLAGVLREEVMQPKPSGGDRKAAGIQRHVYFSTWIECLSQAGMTKKRERSASAAIAAALNKVLPKNGSSKWTYSGVYQAAFNRGFMD